MASVANSVPKSSRPNLGVRCHGEDGRIGESELEIDGRGYLGSETVDDLESIAHGATHLLDQVLGRVARSGNFPHDDGNQGEAEQRMPRNGCGKSQRQSVASSCDAMATVRTRFPWSQLNPKATPGFRFAPPSDTAMCSAFRYVARICHRLASETSRGVLPGPEVTSDVIGFSRTTPVAFHVMADRPAPRRCACYPTSALIWRIATITDATSSTPSMASELMNRVSRSCALPRVLR